MTYNFREGFKQIKRDDLVKNYDALDKSSKEMSQRLIKEIAEQALVILEKEK